MEYVIDNSPITKYTTSEEFFDYFVNNQKEIFAYLEKHNDIIKCFYKIYELELAPGYFILNLFTEKCNPISAYLKRIIHHSLANDEIDSMDYLNNNKCPSITLGKERNDKYNDSLFCFDSLGDYLFENSLINLLDYLLDFKDEYLCYPDARPHYLDKFFEKNRFSKKDLISFRDDFLDGIRDYRNGASRLIKDLGDGLNEFRFNYSNGIIRIFFTCTNGKFVLLNCFIKKTEETPANEKKVARKLVDNYRKSL